VKTINIQIVAALITTSATSVAIAEQGSVLDPTAHPVSPGFESPFPAVILPLDATLSWKNRFNGDETFNENERLGQKASMTGMATTDHSGHDGKEMAGAKSGMGMDATGVIQQIKPGQGKVKIKHGEIERLGMPAMTMMFNVTDVSMLENLEKGQTVGFSVDNSSGGFVLTHLMPKPADGEDTGSMSAAPASTTNPTSDMDARGLVKTIRAGQGKVKIEHGPIDRLGMPAMTMVFTVQDPSQLEGIERGSTVDFSVDNSSGGFVITNIKPAN